MEKKIDCEWFSVTASNLFQEYKCVFHLTVTFDTIEPFVP